MEVEAVMENMRDFKYDRARNLIVALRIPSGRMRGFSGPYEHPESPDSIHPLCISCRRRRQFLMNTADFPGGGHHIAME
jgi:hypothetical protein